MRALLGLGEVELGAAAHHDLAVPDVLVDEPAQVQDLGPVVDEGEHDGAERRAERRVHVELVQHDLGIRVLLQLDHDAHAVAIGLVAQVADAGDLRLAHEVGNLLEERGLVHLERDLGRDEAHAPAPSLLDLHARPHADQAAAVQQAVADALRAVDDSTGREVRALHDLQQVFGRGVRMLDHVDDRVADLAEVVRRHLGGHSDRDARAAVDEEVRHDAREHGGLLAGFIVIRPEVDGVLLEVVQHLDRERREPGLGVPHRRRGVAIDRAEVPLAVDERVAHHPVLREADQCGIDDLLAVRVVVARGVAGDLRALPVRTAGREIEVVHRDQDAALRGLQAVAHVRERTGDDHRHRVIDVGGLHLLLDARVDDPGSVVQWHCRCPLDRGRACVPVTVSSRSASPTPPPPS